jgi:hypothetical protein
MDLADSNTAAPTRPIHSAVGTKKRQSLAKRAASTTAFKCLLKTTSPLKIYFYFALSVPIARFRAKREFQYVISKRTF